MQVCAHGRARALSFAGKGIGKEIAVLLGKLGAQVIALSRTQEDLDALRAAIPGVIAIKVDLANGIFDLFRLCAQNLASR